jgi:hypothetical protein
MYVKQSTIPGGGGGAFARVSIKEFTTICKYQGESVLAADARMKDYKRGYVMRTGAGYVDGRDEHGWLQLESGRRVSSRVLTQMSHCGWGKLKGRGVQWLGRSCLCRFVNEGTDYTTKKPTFVHHNVVFQSSGELVATKDIEAGEELLVYSYSKSFWG